MSDNKDCKTTLSQISGSITHSGSLTLYGTLANTSEVVQKVKDLIVLNNCDTFLIQTNDEYCKKHYQEYKRKFDTDSGLDLICPQDITIEPTFPLKEGQDPYTQIDFKVSAQLVSVDGKLRGYYLYPRSDFTKTPLILANHVGIIDDKYRMTIKARVRNLDNKPFKIKQGQSYFQLCTYDLQPSNHIVVDFLTETNRGAGFGSTNVSSQEVSSQNIQIANN